MFRLSGGSNGAETSLLMLCALKAATSKNSEKKNNHLAHDRDDLCPSMPEIGHSPLLSHPDADVGSCDEPISVKAPTEWIFQILFVELIQISYISQNPCGVNG